MEPLQAEVALYVQQVWIERLPTNAQAIPCLVRRLKLLRQGAVSGSSEERRLEINRLLLVVLLDRVDLALAENSVGKDFVTMPRWKHLILSYILTFFLLNTKTLEVKVLLLVVPLDLDHGLVRLLLATTLFDDSKDAPYDLTLLRFSEEGKFTHIVNHALEHEFAIDRHGWGLCERCYFADRCFV